LLKAGPGIRFRLFSWPHPRPLSEGEGRVKTLISMKNATVDLEELKKANPGGSHIVFEDGQWAFFKKPTRQVVSMAMAQARTNPLGLVDVIVKNCLAGCSEGLDLRSDDCIGYIMGLAERIDDIIGTKKAEIKNS